ncbi:protein transport protein SEC61 subunit beta [Nematocida displodere]|uniref:Protein transport protein SEC61 subunit beta n=1 Tax=Nematocida displodere TaxID=1805483 RepID=A0A177EAL0_9MICR|nr:protein transport protein SEC61 subunit beta [Nematocida displodere]
MKKETPQKKTLAATRNLALKNFIKPAPPFLSLEPTSVLILSLCFILNVVVLHILGRFGSSFGVQTLIGAGALVAALVLGFLVQR